VDPKHIKKILAATDFSEPSARAVEMAVGFARAFGATIELVHVAVEAAYVMPPPVDVAVLPIDMGKLLDEAAKSLEREEARVREAGVSVTSTTLVGRPDAEIVDHATKTGADVIVMGTHGRTGLGRVLLGSVAERVVKHARCPVLIVPWHERK